jgi:hypothetical protein
VLVRELAGYGLDRCQIFQAGHAGSIPVTRSLAPVLVDRLRTVPRGRSFACEGAPVPVLPA